MQIVLHYTHRTRAIRPRWLLEELQVPYRLELVDLFGGGANTPEYRRIHPLGRVPALEIDGRIQLESGAMCHWLADRFPAAGLAPAAEDARRIAYEQWMFFVPGTLEPPAWLVTLHTKILPPAQRIEAVVPWARERYLEAVRVLDDALDGRTYLLGDRFSAADILVGSTLMWLPDALEPFVRLRDYVGRLRGREAFLRAASEPQADTGGGGS